MEFEFITHIENANKEIMIGVDFDYQPYEASTRHYPGCSESVDINYVSMIEELPTGSKMMYLTNELCLLPEVIDRIEEEILEKIYEERNF